MAAAVTLYCEPGDWRGLAACVAAAVAGVQLSIEGRSRAPAAELVIPDKTAPLLITPDSTALNDPCAIARVVAAANTQLTPAVGTREYLLVESTLEWEAGTLRPAVCSCVAAASSLDVPNLSNSLPDIGDESKISLAHVMVWSTLAPLLLGGEKGRANAEAEAKLHELALFKAGLAKVLSCKPHDALVQSATKISQASRRAWMAEADKHEAAAPRLPVPGQRNILVTSALPYVNNVPHLGNIIGCVLSADVYARFARRRGHNVVYVCGTDEYGTATETKAMEEGLTPRQICDKYNAIHAAIYDWFAISFDHFGRTSTPQQTVIAQGIFKSLLGRGLLNEDAMEQPYCTTCLRFLADRFVEGICPHCAYEDARGDQCDKCGKLLNPVELLQPRCKVCGKAPEIRKTEHIFLDLPTIKPQLDEYIEKTSVVGGWSANSVQTTAAWIRDGLKPRCITRDLKWGTPVPLDKYREKVFYVWFDAPIGYISITANYTPDWRLWWHNPKDVEMVQFMGKDNVPFHTIIFPCTLLGTGEPWTLMRTISVCEYLNYEDGKFSKSRCQGVFGDEAKDTGIPCEVWRYYLLVNRPEASDTMFLWSDLAAKNNNELLANLGNFCNRALAFMHDRMDATVPAVSSELAASHAATAALREKAAATVTEYIDQMEKASHACAVKLKNGLKLAMGLSGAGNQYLQETQPWKLIKTDVEEAKLVLATAVGLVRLLIELLEPFMPTLTAKVATQLALPISPITLVDTQLQAITTRLHEYVPAGHKISKPEPIFRQLSDEEIAALRLRFSGNQKSRAEQQQNTSSALGDASVKDKKDKKAKPDAKAAAAPSAGKKGSKEAGKDAIAAAAARPVDVSRLDVRVGRIQKCGKHPDADSLYVEEIDVGEDKPRTVVSGLVNFVPLEEMQGRRCVVLCNLEARKMRGVLSQAMVLAASDAEHTRVELLTPPDDASPGERVMFEGYPGEPDDVIKPKTKIFETVQPDLKTNGDCVAVYKDAPFMTSKGACKVRTLAGGTIR
eukprot:jgi/Chlat1/8226/Chrsp77S07668